MTTKRINGLKVLLVEDQAVIALDLEQMLTSQGAEVVTALNFKQGMRCVEQRFDAAVLDGKLARDTSLPIAAKLREKGVGIVFHSGYLEQAQATEVVPDAIFLGKPARDATIIAAVRHVAEQAAKRLLGDRAW